MLIIVFGGCVSGEAAAADGILNKFKWGHGFVSLNGYTKEAV